MDAIAVSLKTEYNGYIDHCGNVAVTLQPAPDSACLSFAVKARVLNGAGCNVVQRAADSLAGIGRLLLGGGW
jgi:hypothetical protein